MVEKNKGKNPGVRGLLPKGLRKVLITGASGMLGRSLVRRFSKVAQVAAVSKSGNLGTLACDLSKPDAVRNLLDGARYDGVIHAAAYSDVDGCEREPALAYEANALSTKFLAREAGARGVPLIYISTDYVFDGRKKKPYLESDATGPVNVYGLTKLAGEHYAAQCAAPALVVRTSWLFGEGNPKNFVHAITERLKREKLVRVLDDQRGAPTYTEDLAEALEKIAAYLFSLKSARGFQGIFQVCNAGSTTRHAMALKIRDFLGLEDVRVTVLDAKALESRVAIRPAQSVMSAVRYERFFHARMRSWEESLEAYMGVLCAS